MLGVKVHVQPLFLTMKDFRSLEMLRSSVAGTCMASSSGDGTTISSGRVSMRAGGACACRNRDCTTSLAG